MRKLAMVLIELSDIKQGNRIFVNYNFDNPGELGFWYDAMVEAIQRLLRVWLAASRARRAIKLLT